MVIFSTNRKISQILEDLQIGLSYNASFINDDANQSNDLEIYSPDCGARVEGGFKWGKLESNVFQMLVHRGK